MSDRRSPRYLPIDRSQVRLLPLDVDRLITDNHVARRIWRVIESLDLSRFEGDVRAVEGVAGRPPHSPQVLICVWLYAFTRGLHSAREIERQMDYEPALRWLTGLRPINHHTLSDFRVGHGEALRELFEDVLALMLKKDLVTLERVAVDGTKIRADGGKKSFRQKDKIEEYLKLAREHLDELERQEAEEQTTKRQQKARLRAAREKEEKLQEALAEIEQLRASRKDKKSKEPQASTSDPEARFMRSDGNGVAPAYNVQVTADAANGLIADVEVVNDPQDSEQLVAAMQRLQQRHEKYPSEALADGGYTNHASVVDMDERGIDYYGSWTGRSSKPTGLGTRRHEDYWADKFVWDESAGVLVCPQDKRLEHKSTQHPKGRTIRIYQARAVECRECEMKQMCCPDSKLKGGGRSVSIQDYDEAVRSFDAKMETEKAKAIYKTRAPLIEFPNAWIKTKFKLRRFSTRGLAKVKCEARWAALAFNLQRMFKLAPELIPTG
jgi:transposase